MNKRTLLLLFFLPLVSLTMDKQEKKSLHIVDLSSSFKNVDTSLQPISRSTSTESNNSCTSNSSDESHSSISSSSYEQAIQRLKDHEIESQFLFDLDYAQKNGGFAQDFFGERYYFVNYPLEETIDYSTNKKDLKSISGLYILYKKAPRKDAHQNTENWQWGLKFKISDLEIIQMIKKYDQYCIFLEKDDFTESTKPTIGKLPDKQFLILTEEYPQFIREKLQEDSVVPNTNNQPKIYRTDSVRK
jgi:hypothetical protein